MMAESIQYNSGVPSLPDFNDPSWTHTTIRAREFPCTDLRTTPTSEANNSILTVYAGDVVSVMREIRFGSWIAAKVGYKVGWLNAADIGFAMIRQPMVEPEPYPEPPQPASATEWYRETSEEAIPQELLTSHADSINAQADTREQPRVGSGDVNRIIKFLKRRLAF